MTKTLRFALIPAAFAAFASTAVVAQEATPDYPQAVVSSVSRADVRADAVIARNAGQVAIGEIGGIALMAAPIAATTDVNRARVQAEVGEARRLGLIADGEGMVVPTVAQLDAVRKAGDRAGSTRVASN
jgi:hypothetical protein